MHVNFLAGIQKKKKKKKKIIIIIIIIIDDNDFDFKCSILKIKWKAQIVTSSSNKCAEFFDNGSLSSDLIILAISLSIFFLAAQAFATAVALLDAAPWLSPSIQPAKTAAALIRFCLMDIKLKYFFSVSQIRSPTRGRQIVLLCLLIR
ncbi:hypothetical protein HanXRQr2_Chr02g0060741 [Helianthus annuus]|uniref:Uncharacterized protein n=1 Tax=Helianthus annuus TaxID=4232 RepID=A0A9K3JND7_HELAN|nr:hypothetical protein HanXRQr2_Chr02g0060741 [Helianthus annuus]